MAGKETVAAAVAPIVPRLCNEIQLFDLCDLDTCRFKDGCFCTNEELVVAFEQISDAEPVRRETKISEELEEDEEGFDEEYDDAYDDREYDEESDGDDEY